MATPVSDTYGVPSGMSVYAGNKPGGLLFGVARLGDIAASGAVGGMTFSSLSGNALLGDVTGSGSLGTSNGLPNALLNLIAAAPANSWIKANTNTFQSSWAPLDYRAPYLSGVSSPGQTLQCWSSFAWDDTNYRLILWGGGHANSNENSVYSWSSITQQWSLSFHSSDIVTVSGGTGFEPVDGPQNAPQSSHTYDTQQWLPVLRKFVTFGGAASSSAGPPVIRTAPAREVGCYLLDMTLAGQGYVGGTTGSNVHRNTTVGVNLPGAQAWQVRDWFLDNPSMAALGMTSFGARTNAISDLRIEGGRDVVYYKGGAGSLYRIEFVDNDYRNDIITKVGLAWTSNQSGAGGSLDSVGNILLTRLDSGLYSLEGFDLNTAGPSNKNFRVLDANIGGSGAADYIASSAPGVDGGCLFDPVRDYFVMWSGGGSVYAVKRPADMSNLEIGWTATKICTEAASPRPLQDSEMTSGIDTGITGKWRRSEKLDVYIGVRHFNEGNVWIYKPAGWIDPRA